MIQTETVLCKKHYRYVDLSPDMPEWGDMNCIADSRVLKDKILSEIMVRNFANSHRL